MHTFYTLCGTVLQHVSEANYLVVTLSDDRQWSNHISNLSVKASSTLGLLRRNLSQCPMVLREQAYISLIRSRLEYCSAIWDPHLVKDIKSLENIQRRAARFTVQGDSRYTSVSALLKVKGLDWSPLKDRRRDIRLTFLFKIKGKVAVQAEGSLVAAGSRTRKRHDHKYRHLRVCTEQFRNYFIFNKLYRSGTPCLTPVSKWILSPPSRSSSAAPLSCCANTPLVAVLTPPPPPPSDVEHSVACRLNIKIQIQISLPSPPLPYHAFKIWGAYIWGKKLYVHSLCGCSIKSICHSYIHIDQLVTFLCGVSKRKCYIRTHMHICIHIHA